MHLYELIDFLYAEAKEVTLTLNLVNCNKEDRNQRQIYIKNNDKIQLLISASYLINTSTDVPNELLDI